MKPQHYFKVYGADKDETEKALLELKSKKVIHNYAYKGLVACAELELEPIEFSNVAMNADINKMIEKNIYANMGVPSGMMGYETTNAIGHEINQQLDKRGIRKY